MAEDDIIWQEDGTPRSQRFGDVYFSAADGLAETNHVFLGGIGAPEVWQGARDFVIAETGFGTGLNFAAAWKMWRETAGPTESGGARLHYVSAEAFPLGKDDIARALARWPELGREREALLAAYPVRRPGVHHLVFDGGRVRLTLLFGEAAEMFAELDASVDAWFLDGFAPARNPDMWREELFREVARLSRRHARLATFTVAGAVRRGLAAHGFAIEKRTGFGAKRECLAGTYEGVQTDFPGEPWAAPPASRNPEHVAIVGAGIAGLSIAHALTARGVRATVIEAGTDAMNEASGNPAGVLEPQVARAGTGRSLHETGFLYARRFYEALGKDAFRPCGVRHLAGSAEETARLKKIVSDDKGPDPLYEAGGDGVLDIPRAGLVFPPVLRGLLTEGIDLRSGAAVTALEQSASGWRLIGAAGEIMEADAVVLASGMAARTFTGARALPLKARRGQISLLPATDALAGMSQVLSYGGYLTPAVDGFHVLGATFDDANPDDPAWRDVTSRSHEENRDKLFGIHSDLSLPDMSQWAGRTGLRATTPDRLPVAGGVVDENAFIDAFGALRTGAKDAVFPSVPYCPGLYVLAGLGSRGLATAPLLAEIIAAEMTGAPIPLPRSVRTALHPARFLVRGLRRRQI